MNSKLPIPQPISKALVISSISIKADIKSSVGVITDIRLKLRDVNALKLSYSTTPGAAEE